MSISPCASCVYCKVSHNWRNFLMLMSSGRPESFYFLAPLPLSACICMIQLTIHPVVHSADCSGMDGSRGGRDGPHARTLKCYPKCRKFVASPALSLALCSGLHLLGALPYFRLQHHVHLVLHKWYDKLQQQQQTTIRWDIPVTI